MRVLHLLCRKVRCNCAGENLRLVILQVESDDWAASGRVMILVLH
jgi:hypothetical protein